MDQESNQLATASRLRKPEVPAGHPSRRFSSSRLQDTSVIPWESENQ